jgi:hypothetical protein
MAAASVIRNALIVRIMGHRPRKPGAVGLDALDTGGLGRGRGGRYESVIGTTSRAVSEIASFSSG